MKRTIQMMALLICLSLCLSWVVSCSPGGNSGVTSAKGSETEAPSTEKPGGNETEPDTGKQPQTPEKRTFAFASNADRIKLLGRCEVVSSGVTCDYTASGFEACLNGGGSLTMKVNASGETFFTVYADGVRLDQRIRVAQGESEVELTSFAESGVHHIRVLKQTEALNSLCVLKSLTFTGELGEKPANRELFIEFIGDSISCGYGNYNYTAGAEKPGSAAYQDGTAAFPFLSAELLEADCSVVAISGIGVKNGFTSYCEGDVYEKLSYLRGADRVFGFERKPNLVVINLGTNDATFLDRGKGSESEFKAGVKTLLERVRALNGEKVPVVWAYNMMNDGCVAWIRDVMTEMGGVANGLYLCELIRNRDGGNGHPSGEAQKTAADQLAAFIKEKIVSGSGEPVRRVEKLYEQSFGDMEAPNVGKTPADVAAAGGFVALDGLDCEIADGALHCKSTTSNAFFDMQYFNVSGFPKIKGNVMFSMNLKPMTENFSSAHLIDFRFHTGTFEKQKIVVKKCKLIVGGQEVGTLALNEFSAIAVEFCYDADAKLFKTADVYLNGEKVASFEIGAVVTFIDHFRLCRYNTGEWAVDDIVFSKVTYEAGGAN